MNYGISLPYLSHTSFICSSSLALVVLTRDCIASSILETSSKFKVLLSINAGNYKCSSASAINDTLSFHGYSYFHSVQN